MYSCFYTNRVKYHFMIIYLAFKYNCLLLLTTELYTNVLFIALSPFVPVLGTVERIHFYSTRALCLLSADVFSGAL